MCEYEDKDDLSMSITKDTCTLEHGTSLELNSLVLILVDNQQGMFTRQRQAVAMIELFVPVGGSTDNSACPAGAIFNCGNQPYREAGPF